MILFVVIQFNFFIDESSNLLNFILDQIQSVSNNISLLKDIIDEDRKMFIDVSTEYKRFIYLQEAGIYLPAVECTIGQRFVQINNGSQIQPVTMQQNSIEKYSSFIF